MVEVLALIYLLGIHQIKFVVSLMLDMKYSVLPAISIRIDGGSPSNGEKRHLSNPANH